MEIAMNFTHVYAVIRANLAPLLVDVENPETGAPSIGTPMESLNARYPGMTRITYEEYDAAVIKCICKPPVEITEEQWNDALCVLPPLHWVRGVHTESFKCCEFTTGRFTACYVRIGQQYWTMTRNGGTAHEWLVEDVVKYLSTLH
jgi:hypothetical protein